MNLAGVYEFDLGAAAVMPELSLGTDVVVPVGGYKPSDANGAQHNWAGLTFPCAATGNWTLNVSDNAGGDLGTLADWSIVISTALPTTAVFAPTTGLFLNSNGTGPYAGTPVGTVYASPAATTNYTATDPSCPSGSVPFTVTVNPATSITTHPSNTAPQCPGGAANFTVAATGGGTLTYQWQISTDGGGTWNNLANGAPYSNVTTATMTVSPTAGPMSGHRFRVIVTGSCGTATSNPAILNVDGINHSTTTYQVTNACSPGTATISGTATGGILTGGSVVVGTSGNINLAITDNQPAGVNSVIVLPATTFTAASDLKVRITASHTWVGDLRFTLTSPCGVTFLFDRPGVPPLTFGNDDNLGTSNITPNPPSATYTFDVSASGIVPETFSAAGFIPAGSYRPPNAAGVAHNWTGFAFPCAGAGNWTLNVADNGLGDLGTLVSWQILGPNVTPGNYTHTLTGPGTIVQNAETGPNNSTGNFSITNIPGGNNNYTLTSTDPFGCSFSTVLGPLVVNQTPVITITPAAPVVCAGSVIPLTATALPGIATHTFTSTGAIAVPAPPSTGAATGAPANPYPVNLVVAGVPPVLY